MKVFLDDIREPPEDWILFRNVESLIDYVKNHISEIEEISLDHDLGDDQPTGYDFMKWLEKEVFTENIKSLPKITFHTANPIGRKNMQLVLSSIERHH